jgi:hypothetical protein
MILHDAGHSLPNEKWLGEEPDRKEQELAD